MDRFFYRCRENKPTLSIDLLRQRYYKGLSEIGKDLDLLRRHHVSVPSASHSNPVPIPRLKLNPTECQMLSVCITQPTDSLRSDEFGTANLVNERIGITPSAYASLRDSISQKIGYNGEDLSVLIRMAVKAYIQSS